MTIKYYIKQVYGYDTMYLSRENSQEINKGILGLTGRKTITDNDMTCLKLMGYSFERTFN